ncbi:MAG: glycoside hydrolase family 97 catalytic domain-containing protein [Prevotella sp.]|nr:glycoside hydrolase family 97 catalytic domain-containing protein [Prevotella sp.]
MKKYFMTAAAALFACIAAMADTKTVSSPDGKLIVTIDSEDGKAFYSVKYNDKQMVERSALGLKANIADFSSGLTLRKADEKRIDENYTLRTAKASAVHYVANQLNLTYDTKQKHPMVVTFNVSNNDVAFRYSFPQVGETSCMVVNSEETSFRLPQQTTTFICPQSEAMVGWKRTKPSYEEEYVADAPMNVKSKFGQGYTFPCLFRVGEDGWVLISETGTNGQYVGCHLSDYTTERGYQIAFPMPGEANGIGSTTPGVSIPGDTPWRTITVGETLKPIVETTVAYDVVKPLYEPSEDYKTGRYTWSWIVWQDNSVNYDDQIKFIDLASAMGYEYCLVDGLWDKQIGRDRIEKLAAYAKTKNVNLLLWYNSNGYQNDAPQGPKGGMNTSINRKREMAWMKKMGVKGIKVDFFGGDKQQTMQLYEDILSDANDYGIQVIFHGCTLPRGWERMYPNFISSEAVLASENVIFTTHHAAQEPFELTMHPFCRNAVASMDWGGTIMNKYMSQDNKSRHARQTTDIFEMASGIVNQAAVQCVAMCPNNLTDIPQFEIDWLKQMPTKWDETRFIDGYPGKYIILARRSGDKWYVVGLNALKEPLKLTLDLPMFAGKQFTVYCDKPLKKDQKFAEAEMKPGKLNKKGQLKVEIQPNGGLIIN